MQNSYKQTPTNRQIRRLFEKTLIDRKVDEDMLSKENYDKLNENYLYQREPKEGDKTWCRNWTFKVWKYDDGRVYMIDTYFGDWDSSIEVTDENIDEFKFVFDFRDVKRIRDGETGHYNPKDLYFVATDSRGYSCGGCNWVNKNTKKDNTLLIEEKQREIESLERKLEWAKQDLLRLQDNK